MDKIPPNSNHMFLYHDEKTKIYKDDLETAKIMEKLESLFERIEFNQAKKEAKKRSHTM